MWVTRDKKKRLTARKIPNGVNKLRELVRKGEELKTVTKLRSRECGGCVLMRFDVYR